MSAAGGGWALERHTGAARTFHERALPDNPDRTLWLFEVDRPTLVLGSAQKPDDLDVELAGRLGIEVHRRRSGGAAVLLEPGAVVWADLLIGRDDPLWDDDVGRATWWVGHCWRRALQAVGVAAEVHEGPMRRGRYGDRVCFAGLGPGEVLVEGRKAVGIAQRRTRTAARFQTALLLRWDPATIAALVGLVTPGSPVEDELAAAATAVGVPAASVIAALIDALPR